MIQTREKQSLLSDNPTKPTYGASTFARFLAVLFLLAAVGINIGFGVLGNKNVKDISDQFDVYVNPPAFIVVVAWIAIWASVLVMILYVVWHNLWTLHSYVIFYLLNALNIGWIFVWLIGTKTTLLISNCLQVVMCAVALALWTSTHDQHNTLASYYFVRNVVMMYVGWTAAAVLVTFNMVLVHFFSMDKKEATIIFWILAPLAGIGLTFLIGAMYRRNGLKSSAAFWITVLWGLAGALIGTLNHKNDL